MQRLKQSYWRASVAAMTAVCVGFTQIAVAAPSFSVSAPEVSLPETLILDRAAGLSVPETIASIEKYLPGSGKTIFHIQTAHGHYQAEKQIEALLAHLEKNYGVDTVLMEGAANPLDPQIINFFPEDRASTLEAVNAFQRHALITGPEVFLLQSGKAKGLGIENEAAYEKNLQDFASVIRAREGSKQFLADLEQGIERLSAIYLSSDLRAFLKAAQRKETGDIPFDAYLQQLKVAAQKYLEADLSDAAWQMMWPQLVRVFTVEKLEKKINANTFPKDKDAFLKAIKPYAQGALYGEVESLLNLKDLSVKLPDPETSILFEKLIKALPQNFNYERFASVTAYCGLLMLKSQIKSEELAAEITKFEDTVTGQLAEKKSAQDLVAALKDYRMLQKLFALELLPGDYDALKTNALQPSQIVAKLKALNGNARAKDVQFNNIDKLDALYVRAMRFYAGARKRDEKMLARIEERLLETRAEKVAVVTGGFHSAPFAKHFEQRGYSYALMTPKITTIDAEGRQKYLDVMQMWAGLGKTQVTGGADLKASTIQQRVVSAYPRLAEPAFRRAAPQVLRPALFQRLLNAAAIFTISTAAVSVTAPVQGKEPELAVTGQIAKTNGGTSILPENVATADDTRQFTVDKSTIATILTTRFTVSPGTNDTGAITGSGHLRLTTGNGSNIKSKKLPNSMFGPSIRLSTGDSRKEHVGSITSVETGTVSANVAQLIKGNYSAAGTVGANDLTIEFGKPDANTGETRMTFTMTPKATQTFSTSPVAFDTVLFAFSSMHFTGGGTTHDSDRLIVMTGKDEGMQVKPQGLAGDQQLFPKPVQLTSGSGTFYLMNDNPSEKRPMPSYRVQIITATGSPAELGVMSYLNKNDGDDRKDNWDTRVVLMNPKATYKTGDTFGPGKFTVVVTAIYPGEDSPALRALKTAKIKDVTSAATASTMPAGAPAKNAAPAVNKYPDLEARYNQALNKPLAEAKADIKQIAKELFARLYPGETIEEGKAGGLPEWMISNAKGGQAGSEDKSFAGFTAEVAKQRSEVRSFSGTVKKALAALDSLASDVQLWMMDDAFDSYGTADTSEDDRFLANVAKLKRRLTQLDQKAAIEFTVGPNDYDWGYRSEARYTLNQWLTGISIAAILVVGPLMIFRKSGKANFLSEYYETLRATPDLVTTKYSVRPVTPSDSWTSLISLDSDAQFVMRNNETGKEYGVSAALGDNFVRQSAKANAEEDQAPDARSEVRSAGDIQSEITRVTRRLATLRSDISHWGVAARREVLHGADDEVLQRQAVTHAQLQVETAERERRTLIQLLADLNAELEDASAAVRSEVRDELAGDELAVDEEKLLTVSFSREDVHLLGLGHDVLAMFNSDLHDYLQTRVVAGQVQTGEWGTIIQGISLHVVITEPSRRVTSTLR